MTDRQLGAFLSLGAALLLAGCAGAPPAPVPAPRAAAMVRTRDGVAKELAGDHDAALSEFSEALRLYSSIENTRGMALSLLNLARTCRLKGDLPSARQAIERALTLHEAVLADEILFEQGKIELAAGKLVEAEAAARAAIAVSGGERGGRRTNLLALILFRKNDGAGAAETAQLALRQSREAGEKGEEANALRLLGELALQRKDTGQGAQYFEQALLLDKELALGKKIAADLRGLARVSLAGNDDDAAIAFYQRAYQVSRSGGDPVAAAGDLERLAEIYDRKGDVGLANEKRLEKERLSRSGK